MTDFSFFDVYLSKWTKLWDVIRNNMIDLHLSSYVHVDISTSQSLHVGYQIWYCIKLVCSLPSICFSFLSLRHLNKKSKCILIEMQNRIFYSKTFRKTDGYCACCELCISPSISLSKIWNRTKGKISFQLRTRRIRKYLSYYFTKKEGILQIFWSQVKNPVMTSNVMSRIKYTFCVLHSTEEKVYNDIT